MKFIVLAVAFITLLAEESVAQIAPSLRASACLPKDSTDCLSKYNPDGTKCCRGLACNRLPGGVFVCEINGDEAPFMKEEESCLEKDDQGCQAQGNMGGEKCCRGLACNRYPGGIFVCERNDEAPFLKEEESCLQKDATNCQAQGNMNAEKCCNGLACNRHRGGVYKCERNDEAPFLKEEEPCLQKDATNCQAQGNMDAEKCCNGLACNRHPGGIYKCERNDKAPFLKEE